MTDTQDLIRRCCCGRIQDFTEPVIMNNTMHEELGVDGAFCGPVINHELRDKTTRLESLQARVAELEGENAKLREALEPPKTWYGSGEDVAIAHGYTREQYRAAKSIEGRIFGHYQWQNQGDRAASMVVAICQALRDAALARKDTP